MKGLGVNLLYAVMLVAVLCVAVPAASGIYNAIEEQSLTDAMQMLNLAGYTAFADGEGNLTVTGDANISGSVNAESITAPTGRTATYVIAASDAPAIWKAQADLICDGTNDHTDFNTALIAGYLDILASPGTFKTTNVINPITNGSIRGVHGRTIFQAQAAQPIFYTGNAVDNFTIEDLILDGNGVNTGAINVSGAGTNYHIRNCEVKNWLQIGIKSDSPDSGEITNCYIHDNGQHGIALWNNSASWIIRDNRVSSNAYTGIAISGPASNNCLVDGNTVSSNGQNGISVSQGVNTIITNNYCYGNTVNGILVGTNAAHYTQVLGNQCIDNSDNGISIDGTVGAIKGVLVSGNIIKDNDNDGIELQYLSYSQVSGNLIYHNTTDGLANRGGINLQDHVTYVSVTGNTCWDDGTATQLYGIIEPSGSVSSNNYIAENTVYGNVTQQILTTAVSTEVRDNKGYIAPGEIRTASGSLSAGANGDIGFSWHNPELQDCYIKRVVVSVNSAAAAAATGRVGIADDATGTNLGAEFFTAIPLNSTGVYDSYVSGDTGAQTKWIAVQDSASATDGWVCLKIETNDSTATGTYYIEYVGK